MKIIDNFLPEEDYDSLIYHIVGCRQFPWNYNWYVTSQEDEKDDRNNWYLTNLVYATDPVHIKPEYDPIYQYVISHIKMDKLLRVKANMYPSTEKIFEHAPHMDYDYPVKGAIISLNTCDGFTRLEDGTKVDSVANRMLFFNSSAPHNSSTTTNVQTRINININYL
tara:strand:+ start:1381 stop:1878 length:498 start_codon:yes stop_codon:yes gene_type:complete